MTPIQPNASFEEFPFPGTPARFVFKSKNFQFPINERPYYHSFKFVSTIAHSLFQQFTLFEHQNKSTTLLAHFNTDNPKFESYLNYHQLSSEKYKSIKDGFIMTSDDTDTRILFRILTKYNYLASRYLEKLDNILTNCELARKKHCDDSHSPMIYRPKCSKSNKQQTLSRL